MTPKQITDDFYMESWTIERVWSEAKKLSRRKKISRELRRACHGVLADIETMNSELFDFSALGKSEPDTKRIAAFAFQAGIKWIAILWQDGLSKGGKNNSWDLVWQYIRKEHNTHLRWTPARKIKSGIAKYAAFTGKEASHDERYYQQHFHQIILKRHTKT